MEARLIVKSGRDTDRTYPLSGKRLIIGRHKSSDIQIADERASRRHCEIIRDGVLFKVHDFGSANGTYVNNIRLEKDGEQILNSGDKLRVGKTILLFTMEYDSEQEKRNCEMSAFQSSSRDSLKSTVIYSIDKDASDERQSELLESGVLAERDTYIDSIITDDTPLSPARFMIGVSPAMKKVFDLLERAAQTDLTVLIRGETGTGKELAARAIHYCSARRNKTMLGISMPGIPDTLFESQLFGYVKGAFSGAMKDTKGLLELADGGTVLLDEIGELSLNCQAKLLRVLQERKFIPVGGGREISFDTRIIAATSKNLEQSVKNGLFTDALYYRLRVLQITLPPLRERREDIPLLAQHFFERARWETQREVEGISDRAIKVLQSYDWHGNVRELKGCIESAVAFGRNPQLMPEDLPLFDEQPGMLLGSEGEFPTLEEVERRHILLALKRTHWNITRAAGLLGVSRSTLHSKMERHGIRGNK